VPPTPARFEAGTGNIADVTGRLCEVPGLRLIGTADEKASVLSFVLEGFDPQEVGTALDKEGIAVRAGHHCAQPILRRMGVEATVRPSSPSTTPTPRRTLSSRPCTGSGPGTWPPPTPART
jgi:cysteine desulfurase/selenocysteine lyase